EEQGFAKESIAPQLLDRAQLELDRERRRRCAREERRGQDDASAMRGFSHGDEAPRKEAGGFPFPAAPRSRPRTTRRRPRAPPPSPDLGAVRAAGCGCRCGWLRRWSG